MDDKIVIKIDKNRGMSSDILHAIKTVQNDPTGDKKRVIAGGLGSIGLVGAASRLAKAYPDYVMKEVPKGGKLGPAALGAGVLAGMAIGPTYAYANKDNPRKRNIGLGASALSASALCAMLATSPSPFHEKAFAGAVYGTAAALPLALSYTGRAANRVRDNEMIESLRSQGLSDEEIQSALSEHGNLSRDIPESRYIKRPGVVDTMYDSYKQAGLKETVSGAFTKYKNNMLGRKADIDRAQQNLSTVMSVHREKMDKRTLEIEGMKRMGIQNPQRMAELNNEALNGLEGVHNMQRFTDKKLESIANDVFKARAYTAGAIGTAALGAYALSDSGKKKEKEKVARLLHKIATGGRTR